MNTIVADKTKLARVETLIAQYPDWWITVIQEMGLDLLGKLGYDPREKHVAGMYITSFITTTEALEKGDSDWNPICTTLGERMHPVIEKMLPILGFTDDLIREGQMRHDMWLDRMTDDDDRFYDSHCDED